LDVLLDFGFRPDATVMSLEKPGLSFDFGNFKLSACSAINRWFVDIVLFTGILSTSRTLTQVEFELPRLVESKEQCAALIAWFFDSSVRGSGFQAANEPAWLQEGRTHKSLLPWERERKSLEKEEEKYRARPLCRVQRDWLKLGLKSLEQFLSEGSDSGLVEVSFDGKLLWFHRTDNIIVLPADGSRWTSRFAMPVGRLKPLPKRLMAASIEVSVWQRRLQIDQSWYEGVIETVIRGEVSILKSTNKSP
jgi:hypothetical protein